MSDYAEGQNPTCNYCGGNLVKPERPDPAEGDTVQFGWKPGMIFRVKTYFECPSCHMSTLEYEKEDK